MKIDEEIDTRLAPFASTTWQMSATLPGSTPPNSCAVVCGSGPLVAGHPRMPTISSSAGPPPSSSGGNRNGRHSSKKCSKSGNGGGARFNFGQRIFGYGIGAGGGTSAWFSGGSLAHASPLWPLRCCSDASRRRKNRQPRILILMSDTGGGHRASAEALRAGFKQLFGDKHLIDVVDLWTVHTPWPFNQLPRSYSFMVKYPFIWRYNFNMTQPRMVHLPMATAIGAMVASSISEMYERYNPSLVVSVHPLMQHVPVRVLRQRIASGQSDPGTAFATVVTDLTTCHNTWFYSGVDRCYVATEETKRQALSLGLKEEQLRLYGLPIRPAFSRRFPSKRRLRKQLSMAIDPPAVLLVGGGEGMGPVEATVDALAAELGAACQLVVVCGRNARLVNKLSNKAYPSGMHVMIKGFVDNMPDLMSASDVIITKAGPGTISEALICGLPMVLNAFVPCQEEGNIPYVINNEVGVFESNPGKVARVIKGWLSCGAQRLHELSAKAKALGRPDALLDMVRDLESLIKAPMPEFVPKLTVAA